MSLRPIERKVQVPQLVTAGGEALAPEMSQLHAVVQRLAEAHNYHDDQLNSALRGGVSAANNARLKYKKLRIAMPDDAPFTALELNATDGWANWGAGFYGASVLMEPGGRVSMRGLVTGGVPAYGATGRLVTLGAGYAPGQEIGGSSEGGNGAYGLWRVNASGEVFFVFSASVSPYIFLEPLSWIAPNAARPHAFTGGAWPVVVQHGFDQCRAVDVVAARYADGPSGPAGTGIPDWEDLGDGRIRLNGIWGLQWGAVYNVTLRLGAEEVS